jgi:hypothetical protein
MKNFDVTRSESMTREDLMRVPAVSRGLGALGMSLVVSLGFGMRAARAGFITFNTRHPGRWLMDSP